MFFLYIHSDLRDLHSFPTRRSSDLKSYPGLGDGSHTFSVEAIDGERVDRKSTRLNSSHANISYAVFCLKKKNIYIDKAGWSHTEEQVASLPLLQEAIWQEHKVQLTS